MKKYKRHNELPIYIHPVKANLTESEFLIYIKNEINRRIDMIKTEPEGIVRETMIDNLLIDLL